MKQFICRDIGFDESEPETIWANNAQDAAENYTVDYDRPHHSRGTFYHKIRVTDVDTDEEIFVKITHHPEEPKCSADAHDWQRDIAKVGGIESNPGVLAHGGGVTTHSICAHCGFHKVEDSWARDPMDGEQGLESITYRAPEDFDTIDHPNSSFFDDMGEYP